jgi:hypothetical protein
MLDDLPVAFPKGVCHPPCWKPTWRCYETKNGRSTGHLGIDGPGTCSMATASLGVSSRSAANAALPLELHPFTAELGREPVGSPSDKPIHTAVYALIRDFQAIPDAGPIFVGGDERLYRADFAPGFSRI